MGKILVPIINITIAAVLFFGVAEPMVSQPLNENTDTGEITGGIKALTEKKESLNEAIKNALSLQEKVNEITLDYNQFSEDEQNKLNKLVPDSVDNIQLILDVNSIAEKHKLTIRDVRVGDPAAERDGSSTAAPRTLQTASLSFATDASYDDFKNFIVDLSKSMRLVDVDSVAFEAGEKNTYRYNINLKTYWLK